MVLQRALDMVLQHGDDQIVLAREVRIEGAAGEAGGGGNRLDAGRADAAFLEDPGRRLEQLLPRIVAGRTCAHS